MDLIVTSGGVSTGEEDHIKSAVERLGSLYNPDDYPPSLRGLFELSWDFPSVEPPDYLMQLSPAIYEQERARVASLHLVARPHRLLPAASLAGVCAARDAQHPRAR